jgi:hypothetical protein
LALGALHFWIGTALHFSIGIHTKIIGPTWAHPAYAGGRVYARSDSELVCVELPEAKAPPPAPR